MYGLSSVSMKILNQEHKFCIVCGRRSGSCSSLVSSEDITES